MVVVAIGGGKRSAVRKKPALDFFQVRHRYAWPLPAPV